MASKIPMGGSDMPKERTGEYDDCCPYKAIKIGFWWWGLQFDVEYTLLLLECGLRF